jgi:rhomboid protease GluP
LIDLNHILLFLAAASALILLGRIIRLRNPRNRGWKSAAIIVLIVCGLGTLVIPAVAGYVGGIFWALLLVLPSVAERRIDDALLAQRFAAARRIAIVRQIFHPWNDSPYRAAVFSALELAAQGRLDSALDRLASERPADSPGGRFALALTFSLTENWDGLRQWCRTDPRVLTNPAIYTLYLRALGETGALDELIHEIDERSEIHPLHLAFILAFSGRASLLVRQFAGPLRRMSAEGQEFWLATAELANGRRETARARLARLRGKTSDAILRRSIDRRLGTMDQMVRFSPSGQAILEQILESSKTTHQWAAHATAASAPMVWILVAINLVMFAVELLLGGATDAFTLHRLGALEPDAVIVRHEYWRLLSALFLHYGVLHLAFNLYALYLLGPGLERIIGAFRFLLGYLVAGLGSSALVVILRVLKQTEAETLVGASGSVMGVIGISAGLLLRHRQTPLAGQRLRKILLIVALQTAFDLSTPQVSLSAHLGGFITGVAVGMFFARQNDCAAQA